MPNKLTERILTFNADRNPQMLKLKYKLMRDSAYSFYRGTCHLFYEDWPTQSALNDAPAAWVCGDLHLENYGSYKAENRLVYFGMNDFDEAALAPCTWDIARLVTSIFVAAHDLTVSESQARALSAIFLDAYGHALAEGQIRMLERETAAGMVRTLLQELKHRERKDFLDSRTDIDNKTGLRTFRIDDVKLLETSKANRKRVATLIEKWGATYAEPDFFNVLDVAFRVAGTGSLGVERYAILVEGKGSPNHNFILDLKEELPSSLQPYLSLSQPVWTSDAERTVEIQKRVQFIPPYLLSALTMEGKAFMLREMQPSDDRVALNAWNGKIKRLMRTILQMGEVTAWGQMRSAGRQGSAIADDLIRFGNDDKWPKAIMTYGKKYAAQVTDDYRTYCEAYDKGEFAVPK